MKDCPGDGTFVCVGGWLYSSINMMIFPTNKRCPVCNPAPSQIPSISEDLDKSG
jgi:hypothetical protein